jgi:hypothetical protein
MKAKNTPLVRVIKQTLGVVQNQALSGQSKLSTLRVLEKQADARRESIK